MRGREGGREKERGGREGEREGEGGRKREEGGREKERGREGERERREGIKIEGGQTVYMYLLMKHWGGGGEGERG